MREDPQAQDFWSRRRAAVQREANEALKSEEREQREAAQAAVADKTDAEILAELDLPEPESLAAGDDFSAFMAKAVPDRIRRRALRVLWRANPVLANLDELLEYGEDYTDAAVVVENLQTAYQVGRGMLAHIEKMAQDAAAADEAAAAEDDVAENDAAVEDPGDETPAETSETSAAGLASDSASQTLSEIKDDVASVDDNEMAAVLSPRRMKFRSEEPA